MTTDATPKLLRLHFDERESSHGLVHCVTNSLERRANEHSLGLGSAFARQYNAHKLIYFEAYPDPRTAIAREKQLKRWSRAKKEALIARRNPEWHDLFEQMYAIRPCNDPQ